MIRILLRIFLFPFSLLFGIITCVRNKLYDWNFISSVQYDNICVISVGNITVGGTGKTPLVEYLIRLLSQKYRVAVLSRGYKRTTKGFRLVDNHAVPGEVGDEPFQIKRKFSCIAVAVDANRIKGIADIRKMCPDTQVILLDDAFQYRKIRPNLSIILADYNRPLYHDCMLPGGRLREWACFAKRADIMVLTKSPEGISMDEQQAIKQQYTHIFPHELFVSTIKYGEPLSVFSNELLLSSCDLHHNNVLLVTGIANPKPFEEYIRKQAASVQAIRFPDHHLFSEKDITLIEKIWNNILHTNKLLLTTEKDAVRLQQVKIPEKIAPYAFYIPVEMNLTNDEKKHFDEKICVNIDAV